MNRTNLIPRSRRTAATLVAAFMAVALVFSLAGHANAQGLGEGNAGPFVVVDEVDAGQYHVKVWQSPERLVVSSVQVIVELTNAATGDPVDDAIVRVYGTPSEEGQRQVSPALNSPATPQYYEANIVLEHAGLWAFDVEIQGPFGNELVTYSSEVHERNRAGTSLALGTLMFALVGLAFIGGIAYLVWSGRRNRRRLGTQGS